MSERSKMCIAVLGVAFGVAVLWGSVLQICLERDTRDKDALAIELSISETTAAKRLAECTALIERVDELTAERDRLQAELQRTAEALGLEINSESVELTVFRDKLLEVEKRLERAKLDRDNLANELADCRRDRDGLAEEFAQKVFEIEGLKATQAALRHDLEHCRAELAQRPNCCGCHQRRHILTRVAKRF